jgi:hypothetical protein
MTQPSEAARRAELAAQGGLAMSADAMPAGVPFGYCWCGCGRKTTIAKQTDPRCGHAKGEPVRFINGHQNRRQDLRTELYLRVDKNGPTIYPELGPCWLWLGCLGSHGYGQITVNGHDRLAHHVALELEGYYRILAPFGKQQVGHLCDNPTCVRVSHLKIWTPQDDADHMVSKDRQARGERLPQAKLNQAKAEEIRRLYAAVGVTQETLGQRFGISESNIGYILRGHTWKQ